jgi:signal transduction histidine kinase
MYGEKTYIIVNILIIGIIVFIILIVFLLNIIVYHIKNKKLYLNNIGAEMNGREEERKRISKDLHDDLGATLSAVKMYLQGINLTQEDNSINLSKATNGLNEGLSMIRYIMNDLYPISIENFGLESSLEELIEEINYSKQIRIIFINEVENLNDKIEKNDKIHIFRIIKEIINNTIKHSNSIILSIRFTKINDFVKLETIDQGTGYDKNHLNYNNLGHGIKNIINRVELINGTIFLESEINKGVQYTIEIPIKNEIPQN